MLGWEFPPFNTGGLGTACYGLTKGLVKNNVKVTFVLPRVPNKNKIYSTKTHVDLLVAEDEINIAKIIIPSLLIPYSTQESYKEELTRLNNSKKGSNEIYGKDLFQEVIRYKIALRKLFLMKKLGEFDVIHAHDWMTYLAGVELKRLSGKPLIVQVHATEFDRNGTRYGNKRVHEIEKFGMEQSDVVITVSNYTRNMVITKYHINPTKIITVHNAVDFNDYEINENFEIKKNDKIVLFLGRITLQKGPDYFIKAAKLVADRIPNVKFIVVGKGDMEPAMIREVARLGLSSKFMFAGFLRGKDVDRAYKMADVYVMPSVSEPFGITPLEAMRNGTPVIISKQSGVSEVVKNCLKVDFWDVNELANKIIATLKYNALHHMLKEEGRKEVVHFSWDKPARKVISIYEKVINK